MASRSWTGHGSDCFQVFDPCPQSREGGYRGFVRGGSLVLDSDRGELVKDPAAKDMAALKNRHSHSEAERRRRERINAHLNTLRGFVPCTEKMDKATLLSEVIRELKELQKNAAEASTGLILPTEVDEVRVEADDDDDDEDGSFAFRACVCCDYQPELLSHIRQALDTLPVNTVKAEISTLGGRMKNVFVFTRCNNAKAAHMIHQALSSILDKVSTSSRFSPKRMHPNKRQRTSFF